MMDPIDQSCFICKKLFTSNELLYTTTCRCTIYCKRCAMKLATGGKCKICNGFFNQMTSISGNDDNEKVIESNESNESKRK